MVNMKFSQAGQGVTEYIIIVALLAIAAFAIYGLFGDSVRGQAGVSTEQRTSPHDGTVITPASDQLAASKGQSNFSQGAR